MLKPNMEMPEQELPIIFSQMLQMFPNIPQEIIWMYVQQYSRDIEKCAQMLNLQNSKYTEMKPTLDTSRNLNEVLKSQNIINESEIVTDNNNDVPLFHQLPVQRTDENTVKWFTGSRQQIEQFKNNSSSHPLSNVPYNNFPVDFESLRDNHKFVNFNEPLILDIVPDDDEDISHSWRPNVSTDILCPDLFVPSSVSESCNLNSNLMPSFEQKISFMDTEGRTPEQHSICSENPMHLLYGYPGQTVQFKSDIASYLHYQKSQMNVLRYEVIKAKIDLNNLTEVVEKLNYELKEKMQSKSVQDIEELNEEIVQLRLECQCLCTDVDQILNNQGLLGDIDEKCYERNLPSSNNAAVQKAQSARLQEENTNALDDSRRWQCLKCTFANHSAISVCEMCSTAKPSTQPHLFAHAAPTSCYCHPKEKSLSVES